MAQLAPSILSADFSKLGEEVSLIEKGGAHIIHVDVMDGHFVPNISYGATVMKSLNGKTALAYDVHLMIENPHLYIEDFVTGQTEYITVHQEACRHLNRTIQQIHSLGIKAGVSINPATPVDTLVNILPYVDLVLLMSVNPGFGGQSFIEDTLDKSRQLRKIREEKGYSFLIQMDGGISLENLEAVLTAGVDIVVVGSAIFKTPDIVKTTQEFVEKLNKWD
ncbi:MAG: ribulose-phosphate 3-epimerase [Anaerovoracaceae bacterium]|jgi:ribulose-phosphate 3-epimerase|nr:ribulose-phosphate 3-epimerase [Anaerovoracaceae bacterium]